MNDLMGCGDGSVLYIQSKCYIMKESKLFLSVSGLTVTVFNIILLWVLSCPSVAAQTVYLDTLVEIRGCEVYISAQRKVMEDKDHSIPVLMAIHGNGREALNYFPWGEKSIPFYVYQRDIAVDNGYLFIVASIGQETWGTDRGLELLKDVYKYIHETYKADKKWTLWGTSAGGLHMWRLIRLYPERIAKAIGTFPVYDLASAFEKRKSERFVWQDSAEFADINPSSFPNQLTSVPILIFHGRDDKAVSHRSHSLRLLNEVNELGGQVELVIVDGGHSTSNWAIYQKDKIIDFLGHSQQK